jgi:hypothetical protein
MIGLLVISAMVVVLVGVTVYFVRDAQRQASRFAEKKPASLNGGGGRPVIAGDDVTDANIELIRWSALDDLQLARFMNEASAS